MIFQVIASFSTAICTSQHSSFLFGFFILFSKGHGCGLFKRILIWLIHFLNGVYAHLKSQFKMKHYHSFIPVPYFVSPTQNRACFF